MYGGDYFPFGMEMPGRSYIADDNNYVTNSALKNAHRFGFNDERNVASGQWPCRPLM